MNVCRANPYITEVHRPMSPKIPKEFTKWLFLVCLGAVSETKVRSSHAARREADGDGPTPGPGGVREFSYPTNWKYRLAVGTRMTFIESTIMASQTWKGPDRGPLCLCT